MTKKICATILRIFFISILMQNILLTTSNAAGLWDTVFDSADNFIEIGKQAENQIDNEQLKSASSDIYNLLSTFGIVLSVIVGAILGINFMMASAEDKAKVEEALVPYIIGCVVIFGASTIWKICMHVLMNLD